MNVWGKTDREAGRAVLGPRSRPWRLVAAAAIGWGLFTAVVLHLISSHNPVYDTLSSYAFTDHGTGMLAASILSLAVGSLAVLGALNAAGVPLSRTARLLITLWALGLTAAALFPASYPENPDPASGEIHLYSCLVAFLSLPGAAIAMRDGLRGRPERAWLGRSIALTAASFALFGISFIFVRLDEAGVQPFHTLADALPIGLLQRVMLVVDIVVLAVMLRVAARYEASALDRGGELGRVAVQPRQPARVQENHVLVRAETAVRGPLHQRRGHFAGVDRVQHDTLRAAEQPQR